MVVAYIAAILYAANIGASGTAASMGAAYGGGAIRRRWLALALVSGFALLGAGLGGSEVLMTISRDIVPVSVLSLQVSIIVIFASCIALYGANRAGIPLSTSEVSVGSLVGAGAAFGRLNTVHLLTIGVTWLLIPALAFLIAHGCGRLIRARRIARLLRSPPIVRVLTVLLVGSGCYEAFAAGMNNVAGAVGPLVGAGLLDAQPALWGGAVFMAAGAMLLGGRVLETNAKKITELDLLQGSMVSLTSGTLIVAASLLGMPVPLTQATTMAIIGVGEERLRLRLFGRPVLRKIFKIWLLSPLLSFLISWSLIHILIFRHYAILFGVCALLALAAFLTGRELARKLPISGALVRQKTSRPG